MNRIRQFYPLLVLLALMPAFAQGADVADAFLRAEGYAPIDADALEQKLDDLLPPSQSVFRPAGSIGALAKGALALEALDGLLPRARYHLSLELVPASGQLLVRVDRYNLGPLVHQQLIDELGPENVAAREEFGVGPHVSLRLVAVPMMGNRALLLGAARAELPAAEGDCLLTACDTPHAALGYDSPLPQLSEADLALREQYVYGPDGLPTVATLLEMLSDMSGLGEGEEQAVDEAGAETVLLAQALVETGLGQDAGVDGSLRRNVLFDDSVAATWLRLVALPGWHGGQLLFGDSDVECLRGAPQAGLCP